MFHVTCVTRDFTSGLRLWQWQSCRNYGVTCSSSKLQSYVSTHGVFSRMHGTTIITHLKLQCMRKWWLNCSCKSRIALVALQVSCFWLTSCKQQNNIIQFILAGSMFHPIMLRLDANCEQFYGNSSMIFQMSSNPALRHVRFSGWQLLFVDAMTKNKDGAAYQKRLLKWQLDWMSKVAEEAG